MRPQFKIQKINTNKAREVRTVLICTTRRNIHDEIERIQSSSTATKRSTYEPINEIITKVVTDVDICNDALHFSPTQYKLDLVVITLKIKRKRYKKLKKRMKKLSKTIGKRAMQNGFHDYLDSKLIEELL